MLEIRAFAVEEAAEHMIYLGNDGGLKMRNVVLGPTERLKNSLKLIEMGLDISEN